MNQRESGNLHNLRDLPNQLPQVVVVGTYGRYGAVYVFEGLCSGDVFLWRQSEGGIYRCLAHGEVGTFIIYE